MSYRAESYRAVTYRDDLSYTGVVSYRAVSYTELCPIQGCVL